MKFLSDWLKESKVQSNRGRCLHFDRGARCNKVVSAHSIQRKGQLALIAEAGHVYRFSADQSTLNEHGFPYPKRMGIKQVSAFAGFCSRHDSELFNPIDCKPLDRDNRMIALYAYRSLCREFFVKENAVRVPEALANHEELDTSQRYMVELSGLGHSLGLERLQWHKNFYDEALRTEAANEFEFVYFASDSRLSFQLSGVRFPDFDFLGERLQNLEDLSNPLDLVVFFTAPLPNGWAFGFAWHESSRRSCIELIRSLATVVSEGQKLEDALMRFSLACCENHAMRISWWDGLSSEKRHEAMTKFLVGTHPAIPIPEDYLVTGCNDIADWTFGYAVESDDALNPQRHYARQNTVD